MCWAILWGGGGGRQAGSACVTPVSPVAAVGSAPSASVHRRSLRLLRELSGAGGLVWEINE